MRLPVSHGLLHSNSPSNLLVSTFTEAKATAPRYYNDDLLLESLNSKLQSFIINRVAIRDESAKIWYSQMTPAI